MYVFCMVFVRFCAVICRYTSISDSRRRKRPTGANSNLRYNLNHETRSIPTMKTYAEYVRNGAEAERRGTAVNGVKGV